MQTTSQLTANISNRKQTFTQQNLQQTSQHTKPASNTAISSGQVAEMFAKWKIYFKTKMKDEEWGLTNVLLWTAVLNEFDVTEQELIAGTTKACFARELNGWPPTTATDFINVIRGELVSPYPTATEAFDNACSQSGLIEDKYVKRQWLHDVVQLTAHRIGMGKLKTADNKFLSYFKTVYGQVCSEHEAGTLFLIPAERQIAHSHTPVQPDSPFNQDINEFCSKYGSKA